MTSRDDLRRPRPRTAGTSDTWADTAREVIVRVHSSLPETATLADRMAAVDAAYPFGLRKHYPYQVWCRIRRIYLRQYGYVPQNAARGPLLPLMEGRKPR